MSKNKMSKSGFTILELALAMAFMSFLLLAIGVVTIQISQVYQKGIALKLVSNNGRELVDEFTRTILASRYDPSIDAAGVQHFEYTYSEVAQNLRVSGESKEVPIHGAFCTGRYSYIWNTGYALNLTDLSDIREYRATFSLGDDTPETYENFRLLRANDPGREVCINYAEDNADTTLKGNAYHASSKASNVVELLPESESGLVLYDLTVYDPAYHSGTGDALFSASFILGTLGGGIDILAAGNFCTDLPNGYTTDFNYCAINKFNFAARATGGVAL